MTANIRLGCAIPFTAVTAAACRTVESDGAIRGRCNAEDRRLWTLQAPPQEVRFNLRNIADHPTTRPPMWWYSVEAWFMLPPDEVLLCRTDEALAHACQGTWWRFVRNASGAWELAEESGWAECIVVTE